MFSSAIDELVLIDNDAMFGRLNCGIRERPMKTLLFILYFCSIHEEEWMYDATKRSYGVLFYRYGKTTVSSGGDREERWDVLVFVVNDVIACEVNDFVLGRETLLVGKAA
jgi:hypothetical protein